MTDYKSYNIDIEKARIFLNHIRRNSIYDTVELSAFINKTWGYETDHNDPYDFYMESRILTEED